MDAAGALNPLEVIEGKIQDQVGRFLSKKSIINSLRGHGAVTIREEATRLNVVQRSLEGRLQITLGKLETFKTGAWTFGSIIEFGSFANDMVSHINKVDNLKVKATQMGGVNDPQATTAQAMFGDFNFQPWMIIGGLSLVMTWMKRR